MSSGNSLESLALCQALLTQGRTEDARRVLRQQAALSGCAPQVLWLLAELDLTTGDAAQARATLAPIAELPESQLLLAQVDLAEANIRSALERLETLLSNPQSSRGVLVAAGRVLLRTPAYAQALEVLERVTAAGTPLADADASFFDECLSRCPPTQLLQFMQRLSAQHPASAQFQEWLGRAALRAGQVDLGGAALKQAVQREPGRASAWRALSRAHFDAQRPAEAMSALQAVLNSPLATGDDVLLLSRVHDLEGRADAAVGVLSQGAAFFKQHLGLRAGAALYLPQIHPDRQSIEAWRRRYANGLRSLGAAMNAGEFTAASLDGFDHSNFLLAYHGEDDLPLQREYSQWLSALLQQQVPALMAPLLRKFDGARPLRVGFVGAHFSRCTVGLYFNNWVSGLARAGFDCEVFDLGGVEDAMTRQLCEVVHRYVSHQGSVFDLARQIRESELDVLIYPEVGMHAPTQMLAQLRLAPVQCAAWGHPVTTGSAAIDFFISCADMEADSTGSHYTESLLLLPGTGVKYPMPPPARASSREALGLRSGAHLYCCPQSLFKIHPDMDALFVEILAADPEAQLVFFQGPSPSLARQFAARLQQALSAAGMAPRGQIKFLPRLNTQQFREALATMDVILDTLHWSGGNTSLDALAAGTPVVTLPGQFMRGRQTTGMLRLMGLEPLVASSGADYVAQATRIATSTEEAQHFRQHIAQVRDVLFDQSAPITALASALESLAGRDSS